MLGISIKDREKAYQEELEERLRKIKIMLDKAYYDTKIKYGKNQADTAIREYFLNFDYGYFTGSNTRKHLEDLLSHPNEYYQLLLDYAISSFLASTENGEENTITLENAKEYTNTNNTDLNYDPDYVTNIVAISTAYSPYWIIQVLSCNHKLKQSLVESFIAHRYASKEERMKLDNSKKSKIIKSLDNKTLTMSKYQLNRDVDNMNRDDEVKPFDPENKDIESSNKTK